MKKFLIGFAAFISLLVAAVLLVPSFIDWSSYRAEITQQVKQATGRELIIGGKISFTLVPSPVLKVSDIRLANAENASAHDMVGVQQLDVEVALLPLLGGNIHVQSIRLIKPTILLEVLPDGKGNWVLASAEDQDNAFDAPKQNNDPAFVEAPTTKEPALPIQIDDLVIEQGQIIFIDPAQNIHEEIKDLNARFALAGLNGPFEATGTMAARDIPLGFDISVGQIVHGRTASFSGQIALAHGNTKTRVSGTLVNLNSGPKVSAKLSLKGDSLAGLISAFQKEASVAGGLNRDFSAEGEITYGPTGISLGASGLTLTLGEDRGNLQFNYNQQEKNLSVQANFSKIDGDIWINSPSIKPVTPAPLPSVIEPSKKLLKGGSSSSMALGDLTPQNTKPQLKEASPILPKDIDASLSLNIDAIMLKGDAIRQAQANVSLQKGELALERLSAVLPGAGEVGVFGVIEEKNAELRFDGSLDLTFAHTRGALNWAGIKTEGIALERLQKLSVKSDIMADSKQVSLSNIQAKLDGSTLGGGVTFALQDRPSFGASFVLDQLNLDAYLPKSTAQKTSTPELPKAAEANSQQAAQSAPTPASNDPLAALKVINSFDANLDLSLKHLIYQNRDIKNIFLQGSIYDGNVTFKKAGIGDLAGSALSIDGGLQNTDKGVLADNLALTLESKNLSGLAQIAEISDALDWAKLGNTSLRASLNGALLAPEVDLNAETRGTTIVLAGKADFLPLPKADASINITLSDINRLSRALKLDYTPKGKTGPIEISGDLNAALDHVSINNISATIAKEPLDGNLTYKLAGRPYLKADFKGGNLDLSAFMLAENTPQTSTSRTTKTDSGTSGQSAQQASVSTDRWSREKMDFAALKNMDADLSFSAKSLKLDQLRLSNPTFKAELKNAVLNLTQADTGIFGGTATAGAKLDASNLPTLDFTLTTKDLKIDQALLQTGGSSQAKGTLNLATTLKSSGQSQYDMVSSLNGQAQMNGSNIAVNQKSQGGSVLDLLNLLSTLSGRDPSKGQADVQVTANVDKGIATLQNTALTSAIASGNATGTIDLVQWLIDVSGTLKMDQNALIGLLSQKAKMKQSYPFSLKGALDSPNIKLDSGGLSSGGGLVIPLSDKLEKKGYGNVIRGLLGAGGVKTEAPSESTSQSDTTTAPAPDGTLAPPPPAASGTSSSQPSVEQQLIKGLGDLLRKR